MMKNLLKLRILLKVEIINFEFFVWNFTILFLFDLSINFFISNLFLIKKMLLLLLESSSKSSISYFFLLVI